MNICIVTVYNSINSGSFWQAYVLGEFLKENGYHVCYLERKASNGSSNTFESMMKRFAREIVNSGLQGGFRVIKQFYGFKKSQKCFIICKPDSYSDIDCFILGSDTIWNMDSNYFADNRERYWGLNFTGRKVVSYAASVANTKLETIKKYPELVDAVNQLASISVRDIYTQEVISDMTTKKVELVCDPTLLWSKNDYFKYVGEKPAENYILLYLFKPISECHMNLIKSFAEKNNLSVINSVGANSGCDKYIVNTPFEFLRYMYYSSYIITDTYHGTLFSVNFRKRFAVIKRGKNKVNELLVNIHLDERLTEGNDLLDILNRDIDYTKVEKILDESKERSKAYLLNEVAGNE